MISSSALDWKKDSKLKEEQLFERVQQYLFNQLSISKKYFTGEKQFHGPYECQLNLSGGAEWFKPTYAVSFSVNHGLSEQDLKKQKILYHGVRDNKSIKKILQSQLKPGPGQAYQKQAGKNPDLKVPHGIYASQFMNTTIGYTNQSFPFTLQIATPEQIITNRKDYIVIQKAVVLKVICLFKNAPREQLQ